MRKPLRILIVAGFATLAAPAATASDEAPAPRYTCTAEQIFGSFLGGLLPVRFSPEVAALFGVDPATCVTPEERH